jgi:hypothetical protein
MMLRLIRGELLRQFVSYIRVQRCRLWGSHCWVGRKSCNGAMV